MTILSAFLTTILLAGGPGTGTGARQILLFAPNDTDRSLAVQQEIFKADEQGMKDRQITVRVVTPGSDNKTFRSFNHKSRDFLFLLYGKDGGKKFTSRSPVSLKQLYGIIDSMPMRQAEMKQKAHGD